MCYFLWKEVLQPTIHSFKRTGFFWKGSFSHSFYRVGCFFHGVASIMHSFKVTLVISTTAIPSLYGADSFWQQLHIKNNYFFGRATLDMRFFQGFISPLFLQPTVLCTRVSAFVTERMTVIHSLKDAVFFLTWDLAIIYCLSSYFSSGILI